MSADASDLSLVRRVQRGDKGAFDALVLKYQHKLVKLVILHLAVSHSYQHRQERRGFP